MNLMHKTLLKMRFYFERPNWVQNIKTILDLLHPSREGVPSKEGDELSLFPINLILNYRDKIGFEVPVVKLKSP